MKQEHKVSKNLVDEMIKIQFPFSGDPYEVTVMEMLEHTSVIEGYNNHEYNIKIRYVGWKYHVEYEHNFGPKFGFQDTLPNALAKMILFLYENNYITFK